MSDGNFDNLNVRGTAALLNDAVRIDQSWLPSPTFEGVKYTTRATIHHPQGEANSISFHSPGAPGTALVTDGPIMSLESGAFFAGPAVLLNGAMRIDQSWLPNPTFAGVTYTTRATFQCPQAQPSSISFHSPGAPGTALVTDGPIMSLESGAFFAGRVGVGTRDPGAILDVNGHMRLRPGSVPNAGIWLATSSNVDEWYIGKTNLADTNQIGFYKGEWRMVVEANGHVGIGTTSPQATLHVNGDILATGDIAIRNADCAEEFAVADKNACAPGTVMVLGEDGLLRESTEPYDRKVAGVISGAGEYKPGLILDRQDEPNRIALAMLGKVACKVDADHGPIAIGDLLTTSATPGHAMKATDQTLAFGTVIGKALKPLLEGRGLIPILVALQ